MSSDPSPPTTRRPRRADRPPLPRDRRADADPAARPAPRRRGDASASSPTRSAPRSRTSPSTSPSSPTSASSAGARTATTSTTGSSTRASSPSASRSAARVQQQLRALERAASKGHVTRDRLAATPGAPAPRHVGPIGRLGRWTADHVRTVAIAWAVVAVALGVFAPKVETALSGAGWQANGSESVQARDADPAELRRALELGADGRRPLPDAHRRATRASAATVARVEHAPARERRRSRPWCRRSAGSSISADGHTALVDGRREGRPDRDGRRRRRAEVEAAARRQRRRRPSRSPAPPGCGATSTRRTAPR